MNNTEKFNKAMEAVKEQLKKLAAAAALAATLTTTTVAKPAEEEKDKKNNKKTVLIAEDDNDGKNNNSIPKFLTDPSKNKPKSKDFIKTLDPRNEALINKTWPEYSIMVPLFESFFKLDSTGNLKYNWSTSKKTGKRLYEDRCTIGWGNTYTFLPAGNNVFYVYECQDHSPKGRKDSPMAPEIKQHYKNNDQDWFLYQAKLHLMLDTLPKLRNALARQKLPAPEQLSANELWALLIAGYQRNDYDGILSEYKKAKTIQNKVSAFSVYGGASNYHRGTLDRRYILGLLAAGKITIKQLGSWPNDKFAELGIQDYVINGSDAEIVVKDTKYKKVTFNVDDATIATCINKITKSGEQKVADKTNKATAVKDAQLQTMLNDARKAYKNKNYGDAEKLYKGILAKDKNNAEAHNELALVYIRLAEKSKTDSEKRKYYEAACKQVTAGLKSVSDKVTKAQLYYNAGLARDALGKNYATNNNFSKAAEQYNLAKINHNNAYKANKNDVYLKARDAAENEAMRMQDLIRQMQRLQKNR